jgi:hypothetical protein
MPVKAPEFSIEDQRESSSSQTAMASGISGRHTVTHQGQTVIFGEYDPGKAKGRARDLQFESVLESMLMRHARTGIQHATVINFLPLPLVVNSPMDELRVRIDACVGRDLDYTAHTWDHCAIQVKYLGDGVNTPWEHLPIDLAQAFENEYYAMGGVIAITGDATPENLEKPENAEKINACLERMYVWMMSKIIEANGFWNSPNHMAAAAIVEVHRVCATRMFDIGKIPQLPEWIQPVTEQSAIEARCPFCGIIPAVGAVICVTCNEVLDPVAAFLNGKITEEHASLERLTRAEVGDLGISAFVAETSDEKPARLAEGRRKPKSIAQRRAEQEEADEIAAAAVARSPLPDSELNPAQRGARTRAENAKNRTE